MTKQNKIAWITDSTATLSNAFIEENDIYVIPLNIIFGETSYRENIDLSASEFYQKLAESKELPKSSQPAIGDFVELYSKLKQNYEYAIAIHASSVLTGTFQASATAAQMEEFNVEVIDSKIGSYPLGKMVEKGVELEKQGKSYEEIVSHLRTLPDKGRLYLVPGSLTQLQKGGRLSTTQAIIGSLIKLNLIVKFEDGKVVLSEKIRKAKKVKERLFQIFAEEAHLIKEASIVHGNDEDQANEWKKELEELYSHIKFTTTTLSPIAGTHLGQNTLGLGWVNE
ncbi:DegV family protein [Priestia abyssalis]|uniref:DegV family protein n=1 Tax=Priestia abyssalis TaxID=1221450 RepID=UPI0009959DF5|nr:DegV family protein [Priestia abyssalis]